MFLAIFPSQRIVRGLKMIAGIPCLIHENVKRRRKNYRLHVDHKNLKYLVFGPLPKRKIKK